ncbi:MAG: spore coat protein U domain-containing protein [Pseudomonadota bacterium]
MGVAVAAALAAAPSIAAQATANLNAEATVVNTCTINGATMNFASLTFQSPTTTQTANIDFRCTKDLAATIEPQSGANYAAGNAWRLRPASGPAFVNFTLFRDDGTTAFEPGSGVAVTGTGNVETLSIKGTVQAFATVDAPAGLYTAIVPLVITYTP